MLELILTYVFLAIFVTSVFLVTAINCCRWEIEKLIREERDDW